VLEIRILTFVTLIFFCSDLWATRVAYFTIGTQNGDQVAAKLAKAGFTLKKPHRYLNGFQEGLIMYAVKLKNGQYFELVTLDEKNSKRGELARWYQAQIKQGAVGVSLILGDMPIPLEQIHLRFEKAHIKSQLQKFDLYTWLSFKTESPYAPLSFIEGAYAPADSDEVLTHKNGAYALGKVHVRPYGDSATWAKILTLADAHEAGLEFNSSLFSGQGFITEVEIKTKRKPLPAPLVIDHIVFKFVK